MAETQEYGNHGAESLEPVHPGEILAEEYLKPYGMTPYRLARGTGMTPSAVAEILRGQRSITANVALRLSRFLGGSPEYWLNLQRSYDLRVARTALGGSLDWIRRYDGPVFKEEDADLARGRT
jgi:addiction module HigA family antidote